MDEATEPWKNQEHDHLGRDQFISEVTSLVPEPIPMDPKGCYFSPGPWGPFCINKEKHVQLGSLPACAVWTLLAVLLCMNRAVLVLAIFCWCGDWKSELEVQQSLELEMNVLRILQFFYRKMPTVYSTVANHNFVSFDCLNFSSSSRRASVQHEEYSVNTGKPWQIPPFTKAICLSLPFGKINEFDFWTVCSLSLKIFIGTLWVNKVHPPSPNQFLWSWPDVVTAL